MVGGIKVSVAVSDGEVFQAEHPAAPDQDRCQPCQEAEHRRYSLSWSTRSGSPDSDRSAGHQASGIEPALSAWESDMNPRSVLTGRMWRSGE